MKRWKLGAFALAVAGLSIGFATPAGASGTFFPYSQPGTPASPSYTGTTCAIDLSSISDGATVTSVTGCGVTVSFSVPMTKETVPNGWATWGSPPDTESSTPAVLWAQGSSSVTLTYHTAKPAGAGRRTVGVEVEPDNFASESFTATFTGTGNVTDGTITHDANGNAGATLFAARTKTVPKVASLTITDNSGDDFSIAQIRV